MSAYNPPRILNENVSTLPFNVNDYRGTNTDILNVLQNDNRYLQIYDYPKITLYNFDLAVSPVLLTDDESYTTQEFLYYQKFRSSTFDITAVFTDVRVDTNAEGVQKINGDSTLIINDIDYETRNFGITRHSGQNIIVNNNYFIIYDDVRPVRFRLRIRRINATSDNNANILIQEGIKYKIIEFKNI